MSAVLFREAPPVVDALIEQRRRTGIDRLDEVWEGVYVVNPPPSFRHAIVADRIAALLRSHAETRRLVVTREVGLGRPDDHRIPDVVIADTADLDDRRHYLLTAKIVVEVLSPNEASDKRPFYLAHGVAEVVHVDLVRRTVEWWAVGPGGDSYQPVSAGAVLPVGPADLTSLLDDFP